MREGKHKIHLLHHLDWILIEFLSNCWILPSTLFAYFEMILVFLLYSVSMVNYADWIFEY